MARHIHPAHGVLNLAPAVPHEGDARHHAQQEQATGPAPSHKITMQLVHLYLCGLRSGKNLAAFG
jgi:hypothetical protein